MVVGRVRRTGGLSRPPLPAHNGAEWRRRRVAASRERTRRYGWCAMTIVVVSGALANKPGNGGNAWSRFSWVDGFSRLGFDTYFVEQFAPGSPRDTRVAAVDWASQVAIEHGLVDRFAIVDERGVSLRGI